MRLWADTVLRVISFRFTSKTTPLENLCSGEEVEGTGARAQAVMACCRVCGCKLMRAMTDVVHRCKDGCDKLPLRSWRVLCATPVTHDF
jgi:hypothetical protein